MVKYWLVLCESILDIDIMWYVVIVLNGFDENFGFF